MIPRENFWPDPLAYTYEHLVEIDGDLTAALAARQPRVLITSVQDKVRKLLDQLRTNGGGE